MTLLSTVGQMSQSEFTAALLGIGAIAGFVVWSLVRSILSKPLTPDPWDKQVADELENDDGLPICHRCLTPHDLSVHFCTRCGAMVGAHTNLLPPLFYYSIGLVLRAGIEGTYRRSKLVIIGYVFPSLFVFVYVLFVPLPWPLRLLILYCLYCYWRKLFRNIPPKRFWNEVDMRPPIAPEA